MKTKLKGIFRLGRALALCVRIFFFSFSIKFNNSKKKVSFAFAFYFIFHCSVVTNAAASQFFNARTRLFVSVLYASMASLS